MQESLESVVKEVWSDSWPTSLMRLESFVRYASNQLRSPRDSAKCRCRLDDVTIKLPLPTAQCNGAMAHSFGDERHLIII